MEIGRSPSETSLYHNIPLTVLEFLASPVGSPTIEYCSYMSGYTCYISLHLYLLFSLFVFITIFSFPLSIQLFTPTEPQKKSTNRKNILSSVVESARLPVSPLQEIPGSDLGISSVVEVNVPESDENLYGVIRWIGVPPNMRNIMVGVELDDYYTDKKLATTDGSFNGIS